MVKRVTWEVVDGYAGKARPQITVIPNYEFDCCETDAEVQEVIEEIVQQEFEQCISWIVQRVEDHD